MELTVTFVGNATTLISFGGLTVLTDPNFLHQGQYAYLGHGIVSRRRREPALGIDDLPPIDAIALSHLHGDHWDRVAQRGLDHRLPILTTPHAARRLVRRGFGGALGMQTWSTHSIIKADTKLTMTSLPGRHAPGWTQALLPPVMGTMFEFGPVNSAVQRRLYVSGDTLLIEDLKEVPLRFAAIDAGVLHLGGTRLPAGWLPFGLMVTMDARQGVGAFEAVKLPKMIPVHFDDYTAFASPLADFKAEMERRGWADRIIEIGRGETVTL
jgi:L-ascorbate metabolism protein UlaG (beta-lactamase superfamily)